ncbi:MAG TPA: type 1 glutamine amidotransferase domain-containing protein, partial [Gammaproteobacteria bacterium]|nr:type 1 glutamine amidotransferase domain-containing protein [Gammaproteobacteria bacterium]
MNKKILIIVTSNDELGDSGEKTGFHLSELTIPFFTFLEAGYHIDIASPKGGEAPIDPNSYDLKIDE